jgi:AAA ATPase domain
MDQGPFEQVKRIKAALLANDAMLPGLIAVLSSTSSADLLLVYVGPPPDLQRSGLRMISADQLRDEVLTGYDGPTIGLAAIDHIRQDIGTKGNNFVRLDRILRRGNLDALLRSTWAALGDYLAGRQDDSAEDEARRKAAAEIAAIKAPAMIAELAAERRAGLVAVVPGTGQAIGLDELAGDGLPLGNLSALQVAPDETLITFEEIRPLAEAASDERLRDRYPIELRTVLRRGKVDGELDETRGRLAAAFHARWQLSGNSADRDLAYALAVEGRLAHRDVDDLVAVIPCADFGRFAEQGTGTYVYRRPIERAADLAGPATRSLYLDEAVDELRSPPGPVVFSLLPLRDLCGLGVSWCDLGPPLRKSARTEILARNAWLLVEDLIEDRRSGRPKYGIAAKTLFDTMVHCCVIYSLIDPWRTRQGRRNGWVLSSYRTLSRVIKILQQEHSCPEHSGYFEALENWYSCAFDDMDVEAALNAVVEQLARPAASAACDANCDLAQDAERLKSIAVPLRQLLSGGARAEAYEVLHEPPVESIPQVTRRATDMTEPPELLSVPFGISFREYAELQERIRRLSTMAMGVRDKTERLAELKASLDRCKLLIFAPQHEARILGALCGQAQAATERFISQLSLGAAVELKLQTRSVELAEDSRLHFSVRNLGSRPAAEVELELQAAEAFELTDLTYKQALARLAPEEEHAFWFGIRCVTDAPDFRIRCVVSWANEKPQSGSRLSEVAERQQVTQDFMISTIGIQAQPFRKKPNPYVFGVHVQDYRRFFGRQDELDELLGHLAHGGPQNVLLRAPRRAGKTSLLHMIMAVLTDADRAAGVRDWFEVPHNWDESLNATVPVMLNLQGIEDLQRQATPTAFYRAVISGLREAGLHGPTCDQLVSEPFISYTRFARGMRELVTAAGGRRPVILLDEFDVLDTMPDKIAFYHALRTFVADVQGVTWFVVSALGLYKEIREYASPLFNIFKIVTMGRMDTEAARKLVTSPWEPGGSLASASLSILPDAVYAILEEAGNYPYFIQMVCSEVVNFVNTVRSNQVRFSTVQQVVERRMVLEGGAADLAFDYMWQGASPAGKLLLLTLLHQDTRMAREELKAAARLLLENRGRADLVGRLLGQFDDGLIRLTYMDAVRLVPGKGYKFGVPIFRRLLLRKTERNDLEQEAIEELAASVHGADQ